MSLSLAPVRHDPRVRTPSSAVSSHPRVSHATECATGQRIPVAVTAHSATRNLRYFPTGSTALPDPAQWSSSMARGIVEVLSGSRPIAQLRRWVSNDVWTQLESVLAHHTTPRRSVAARVRATRVCHVRRHVIESAVLVTVGKKHHALALRLEAHRGRWVTTAISMA